MKRKVILLLLAAALVRLVPAALYYNAFDIESYHLQWALYGAQDLFGLYGQKLGLFYLDYPPLIPSLFAMLGRALSRAVGAGNTVAEMLLLKSIPVAFDVATVALLAAHARKNGSRAAWAAAVFWAVNPAAIYNCAFWGQTDTVLCFFLLWMLLSLTQNRPVSACLAFSLGCLSKLQMAYFAPVLLIGLLFVSAPFRRRIAGLAAGGALGALVWLPFMLRSGWTLPLDIYLGGFNKYGAVHLNAGNLYAFGRALNGLDDSSYAMGLFPFSSVNRVIWGCAALLLAGDVALRLLRRNPNRLCETALLYWTAVFLFTTRMHERYLMPSVAFAALSWALTSRRLYGFVTVVLGCSVCLNQFVTLFSEASGPSAASLCALLLRVCAAVQLAVFAALAADMLLRAVRAVKTGGIRAQTC